MMETLESLLGAYKGRYKNKFIGTFVLFYLALNWKKVVVLIFVSDITYREFIFHWSDDLHMLVETLAWAFILTCLYLAVSPWLSFVVHVAQSKAITEYKIQTIKNERKVIEEKEKLENLKKETYALEKENTQEEELMRSSNHDKDVFKKLSAILSEKKLILIFDEIKGGGINPVSVNILKDFFYESGLLENELKDDSLRNAHLDLMEKIKGMLDIISGMNEQPPIHPDEAMAALTGRRNKVVDAYRNFLGVGMKLN